MIKAPLPYNEAKRLSALRDLVILDTPPEERFDRISAFAAQEFNVPIALVSLVDQDRQWFKSSFGMEEVQETPRDISFCANADHGLLFSLTECDAALGFLTRLRAGGLRCEASIPVVAMAHAAGTDLVAQLKELDVRRLLLQPFRLRDVVHTLEQLWPAPEALPL